MLFRSVRETGKADYRRCYSCQGTGKLSWFDSFLRNLFGLDVTCKKCNGRGKSWDVVRREYIDTRTGEYLWKYPDD